MKKNTHYLELKALEGHYFTQAHSAAGRWLNYKLLRVEPGEVEVLVSVRKEFTNPAGQLHGGIMALLCDELCGLSLFSVGNENFYTTISLNVNFLYAVPEGNNVRVKATVLRSGKRIANIECYLYNEEDTIIAHATSNMLNTGTKFVDRIQPI